MTLQNKMPKLLIVDDETDLRDAISENLELCGFEVATSKSGNEAIEILKKSQFDLILSDIRMPDGDGITLLDAVRKTNPKLPVLILMTGYADISSKDCIERGAQLVVSKPFSHDDIMQALRKMLPDFTF